MVQENPLPLEKEDLSYASKLLEASENGMIKVRLEEDVVVQRISHDLYSNPNSGFREFYANELRACRLAAKRFGARPRIVITLSPSDRILSIQGMDSLGISQERFLQVYSVLGRSDNFDPHEVGQWGFGRGAYTTLSDTMVLETWSREDGTKYAVLGKSGVGYNILPEPRMESYGTKVTFILRGDIDIHDLVDYIEKCAVLGGVETRLVLTDDLHHWRYGNKQKGEYILNKTVQQLVEEARTGINQPVLRIGIEDEDLSLNGFMVTDTSYRTIWDAMRPNVFLVGMPIQSDIKLPLTYFVLNIKDERKYPPTADRERLTERAEKALVEEKIIPLLRRELSSSRLNARTVDEYLALDDDKRVIVENNPGGLLPEETIPLSSFLNIPVKARFPAKEKEGHSAREDIEMHHVIRAAGGVDNIFYRHHHSEARMKAISLVRPEAVFIRLDEGRLLRNTTLDMSLDLMRRFGVQFVDDFIEANNIQVRGLASKYDDVIVHKSGRGWFSWGRYECTTRRTERVPAGELDGMVIAVPRGRMRPYMKLVGDLETTYKVTADRGLRGPKPLEEFLRECQTKTIITSRGRMTLLDLAKKEQRKVELHLYSDPHLAEHYPDLIHAIYCPDSPDSVHVFGGDDLLFEVAAVLTFHGKEFRLDTDGHDEFDRFSKESKLGREQFIRDPYYRKVGDAEILYSVIHAEKAIRDPRVKELFLNAARHLKNASDVRRMREYAFQLDSALSIRGLSINEDPETGRRRPDPRHASEGRKAHWKRGEDRKRNRQPARPERQGVPGLEAAATAAVCRAGCACRDDASAARASAS
jgi:hypothetical protein